MNLLGKRRVAGLVLSLMIMSSSLVACGGSTAAPTAVPPAPTNTTAPAAAAPTNTTAPAAAAPTNTTAPAAAAPTDTPAPAAAAPTDTPAPAAAAPTDTPAAGGNGGGGASGDAALFQQAVNGMKALKSYHMDITTDAGGQNVAMAADVDVANKKLRMDTSTGGQKISIIVIGTDAWMSMDGGKTYTANPAGAQMTQSLDGFINMWNTATLPTPTGSGTNGLKAGTPPSEQIDGVDTQHFTIDSKDFGGGASGSGGAGGTVDLWVSSGANPGIRQMKTATTGAGQSSSVTIKWSKFDEDLGITAPPK
ncbi:MAG TPA: hypothetical protein VKY74_19130 [Chloroflexia bacterium]|nr:hypothetical protein [Chloroflexia bacterium]